MKQIPFVANHQDNLHCVNAVFRMLHQYYFGYDLSWSQIGRIAHNQKGKGTWSFPIETYFAKKGIQVFNIEPIDYQKLYDTGESYFYKVLGEKTAKYFIENSNFAKVKRYIPEFIKYVRHETRRASTDEIIGFLKNGNLISTEINMSIMNLLPGFILHDILLYDFRDGKIIFHDPGLPPVKSREITPEKFSECFNFEGANGEVTVFGK
jgi:hypothetical protein